MRLWSLHPSYLDGKGLVAVWREGLLAKKVLEGRTSGYTRHPQLKRFRSFSSPVAAVDSFLLYVYQESVRRGYNFSSDKLGGNNMSAVIPVTYGQLEYEFYHLMDKLKLRDKERFLSLSSLQDEKLQCNPVFFVVDGPVEEWERIRSV